MSKTVKKENETTLFDKLYSGAKDVIRAVQKPLVVRSIERKISSGHDDAQGKIDKANLAIHKEVLKVSDIDMQFCLNKKKEIRELREMQNDLNEIHKDLFNVDYVPGKSVYVAED